jgi:hypothetical protein
MVYEQYRIAAVVPCYNEEAAVAKVVHDLRHHLPTAVVYVYDNGSTDRTVERAAAAGAIVRHEPLRGKGNVVRRAFADIDADIYLLVDGDDTYDAAAAPALVERLVRDKLDHVLGVRTEVRSADGSSAYRPAHAFGNRMLNRIVCSLFGDTMGDMLSGYRVFSRRFVKSFPALSRGFEIETELTVHTLALRIPSSSHQVGFRDRAAGSESKLHTLRDGWRILRVILGLLRHERPVAYFGALATALSTSALLALLPVLVQGGGAPSAATLGTLVTAGVALVVAVCLLGTGLVLEGVRRNRHELSRLGYLSHSGVVITEPLASSWSRAAEQGAPPPAVPAREPADTVPVQRGGGLAASPT